ncbi:MAG: hypothetical protein OEY86_19890 [Nitrospira sp.]|nr:hypothetical protein [Nitrospira sp.]
MGTILFTFVALTSFIIFFGTKIAYWLSDEDSPVNTRTAQPQEVRQFYSRGYQAAPREVRTFRYHSSNNTRLPLERYQQPAIRQAA